MKICDTCGKHVSGYASDLVFTRTIFGTTIQIHRQGLVCEHCGHALYDDALEASVTKEAIATYRRSAKLLPADKVRKMVDTMGAERLAALTNCRTSELINAAHTGIHSKSTDAALRKVMSQVA